MSKYDKMIELNRERSVEKIVAKKVAISKMLEDGERISAPRLMKMTELSINNNVPEMIERCGNNSWKITADIYIDGRSEKPWILLIGEAV